MPHLHETPMGRKFFTADLPRLVDAIEKLAKAINDSNQLYELSKGGDIDEQEGT